MPLQGQPSESLLNRLVISFLINFKDFEWVEHFDRLNSRGLLDAEHQRIDQSNVNGQFDDETKRDETALPGGLPLFECFLTRVTLATNHCCIRLC